MFQFPRCPPASRRVPGVSPPAGCPIRTPPDRRLPAPPRGVSPRGRVLHRPPTPRHPPCAHLRGHPPPRPAGAPRSAPRHPRTGHRHDTRQTQPLRSAHRSLRVDPSARVGAYAVVIVRCGARGRGASPPRSARPRGLVGPRALGLSRCSTTPRHDRTAARSPASSAGPGGAAGARTPDLRRARAALSRLSYGPPSRHPDVTPSAVPRLGPARRVGAPGLEPGTSALSGPRSDRLSYAPARRAGSPHARRGGSPPPRRTAEAAARRGREPGRRRSARAIGPRASRRRVGRRRPAGMPLPAARAVARPGLPPPAGGPAGRSTPACAGEQTGARCPRGRASRPGADLRRAPGLTWDLPARSNPAASRSLERR